MSQRFGGRQVHGERERPSASAVGSARTRHVSGLVVLCAANNWDDVRLADRPLAEELARHSPVLYVDPPLSHLAPRHNPRIRPALEGPRLREVKPNLFRLTPVVAPTPFRPPMVPLTRLIVRRRIRQALQRLGGDVSTVISTLLLVDVFDLAPEAGHFYWMQDDVATGALHWGQDPHRLLAGEARVARAADGVLTASPLLAHQWRSAGFVAHALPNGCDLKRFLVVPEVHQTRTAVQLPAPVAGFVGHLNERTDLALLESVLAHNVSLLLVGPVSEAVRGPRLSRILAHPRVSAVGAQPYEDMNSWLATIDVGLVPYRNDQFNRYSFPLKTLEYLAAGLPVVSTALPAVSWLDCPEISQAATPEEFGRATALALQGAHDPLRVTARRAFAAQHTWEQRALTLRRIIKAGV